MVKQRCCPKICNLESSENENLKIQRVRKKALLLKNHLQTKNELLEILTLKIKMKRKTNSLTPNKMTKVSYLTFLQLMSLVLQWTDESISSGWLLNWASIQTVRIEMATQSLFLEHKTTISLLWNMLFDTEVTLTWPIIKVTQPYIIATNSIISILQSI